MSFSPRIILSQRWHSGRNASAEFLASLVREDSSRPRSAAGPSQPLNQPDRTKTPRVSSGEPISAGVSSARSRRSVDRFPEGRKLMILAVVPRVYDVPVATVEAAWARNRGEWVKRKTAGQTASFQVTTSPMMTRTIPSGRLVPAWVLPAREDHLRRWRKEGERGGRARQPARPLAVSQPGGETRTTVADRVARKRAPERWL